MIIAVLLMIIALIANLWLWGQWSVEKPTWWTVTLFINSLLILLVYGLSFKRMLKLKSIKKSLKHWPLIVAFYVVIILTLLLYRHDFQFVITAIVALKLISGVAMFFYKRNKKKKI